MTEEGLVLSWMLVANVLLVWGTLCLSAASLNWVGVNIVDDRCTDAEATSRYSAKLTCCYYR
jgi:hypothetical protein